MQKLEKTTPPTRVFLPFLFPSLLFQPSTVITTGFPPPAPPQVSSVTTSRPFMSGGATASFSLLCSLLIFFSLSKVPSSSSYSQYQPPISLSVPPHFSLSTDYFSFFLHNNSNSSSNKLTVATILVSSFSNTGSSSNTDSQ